MEDKNIIKNLKYEFTEAENRRNAKELARQNQALVEAELKKKQVTADLKAEAERIAAGITKLALRDSRGLTQYPQWGRRSCHAAAPFFPAA